MSLRYALLALLRVGPLSGYELQKQFSASVGHVWHAPDSQIYPELRKMEAESLIEGEEQPRGQRATRRVYHVTDAGDAAFLAWMQTPLEYARVRDPAHLRAAYLEAASPEAARDFFRRHSAQWEAELAQWEGELLRIAEVANPMLVRRLAVTDPADRERTIAFKRFTYEGLVDRARIEIAWAQRGLKLIDELEASAALPEPMVRDGGGSPPAGYPKLYAGADPLPLYFCTITEDTAGWPSTVVSTAVPESISGACRPLTPRRAVMKLSRVGAFMLLNACSSVAPTM